MERGLREFLRYLKKGQEPSLNPSFNGIWPARDSWVNMSMFSRMAS